MHKWWLAAFTLVLAYICTSSRELPVARSFSFAHFYLLAGPLLVYFFFHFFFLPLSHLCTSPLRSGGNTGTGSFCLPSPFPWKFFSIRDPLSRFSLLLLSLFDSPSSSSSFSSSLSWSWSWSWSWFRSFFVHVTLCHFVADFAATRNAFQTFLDKILGIDDNAI